MEPTQAYDSVGGTVSATENMSGLFQVTFPGLAFTGGDVQVSGIDPQGSCAVTGWGPSGSDLVVNVACYHLGVLSDDQFEVLATRPGIAPTGALDFAWDNRSAGTGPLTGSFSYNSAHKTNSVKHTGPGRYLVTFPGPASSGANTGTVKVTPYGLGSGSCQIASWMSNKTAQVIGVDCFTATGLAHNRMFTISYARDTNLMGLNGKVDANALANSTAGLYQPMVQYDSSRHAQVTVVHIDTGTYEVVATGSYPTHHTNGGNGNIEVTPVGTGYVTCGLGQTGWTHQPVVYVTCYNATAHPANAAFTFQWVVPR